MIRNFDEEAYLDANLDVKQAILNGDFPSVEIYLEQFGLERIKEGEIKFHKDMKPFDEAIYLKSFPEVETLLEEKKITSIFDHFCNVGYHSLVQSLQNRNKIINQNLKNSEMIKGFDNQSYLSVNSDVKQALERGDFPSVEIYLEQFGLERIKNGSTQFHHDFKPFDEVLYLKEFSGVG